MKKWICLFVFFVFLQASAQYSYTYTDPCTLQSRSVFVPAGGGVMVNYFDNHNIFTANDFSSGVFDSWIATVSQQNSNSPCQSITTTITNNVNTAVVSNTVNILTNVVAISSLAQSMASISSSIGGTMSSTAGGISSMDLGNSVDNNQTNSNEKTDSKDGGNSGSVGSNQTNNQNEGSSSSSTPAGGNNSPAGGTNTSQGGSTPSTNQPTKGGKQTPQSPVSTGTNTAPTTTTNGTINTNGGNTGTVGQTTPNSTIPANSTTPSGTGASTAAQGGTSSVSVPTGSNESTNTAGEGSTANSISNVIDGGSSDGSAGGGSTSSSSKKQANAKTSSGSLIASGDMVAISNTDGITANQYKFVGSITHANTRGTRIKGVLFNYTTGVNNMNVTLYKSWINKKRTLNLIVANSTMIDFEKNIFNTTTGLESYKVNKSLTGMFGLNFTAGKMGEREFLNLSAVGGGHVSTKVTDKISTSFLVLAVYSPFTQFYDGKWWNAGVLFVPFSSWDFKITKTFKYNVSFTGVYEMNQSFLNYQILTGGKIAF